jgi:hypothetical protein
MLVQYFISSPRHEGCAEETAQAIDAGVFVDRLLYEGVAASELGIGLEQRMVARD